MTFPPTLEKSASSREYPGSSVTLSRRGAKSYKPPKKCSKIKPDLRHGGECECDFDGLFDGALPSPVCVDNATVAVPGDGHDRQRGHEHGGALAGLGQPAQDVATSLEPQASVENLQD